jgi:hypothetical protein
MEGSKNKKWTPKTKGNLKLTDKWKFIIYVEDHNQYSKQLTTNNLAFIF